MSAPERSEAADPGWAARPEPPGRVAVLGLGLIGGSVALGLGRADLDVVGWSRSEATRAAARAGGVAVTDRLADAVEGAATVVIAADLGASAELLTAVNVTTRAAAHSAAGTRTEPPTITDVGSVKTPVLATAAEVLDDPAAFVGGHPLAGTEAAGFGAATPDLFSARPWALATDPPASDERIEGVARLAEALGAAPVRLTAAEHDRTVGLTSHLVHVIAAELCRLAAGDPRARELAGGSFVDATRVARGEGADLGRMMATVNASAVAGHLDAVIADLAEVRDGLAAGDPAPLDRLFADAAALAHRPLAGERAAAAGR